MVCLDSRGAHHQFSVVFTIRLQGGKETSLGDNPGRQALRSLGLHPTACISHPCSSCPAAPAHPNTRNLSYDMSKQHFSAAISASLMIELKTTLACSASCIHRTARRHLLCPIVGSVLHVCSLMLSLCPERMLV